MTSRFRWQIPETDYRAPAPPAAGRRPVPGSATRQLPGAGPRALPGQPTFQLLYCNWTRGCKWSMALALSITLDGLARTGSTCASGEKASASSLASAAWASGADPRPADLGRLAGPVDVSLHLAAICASGKSGPGRPWPRRKGCRE